MASNRIWVRELDGQLLWIRQVEGRLILSNRMPAVASVEDADCRELTRAERIAWRLLRRPPKNRPRVQ